MEIKSNKAFLVDVFGESSEEEEEEDDEESQSNQGFELVDEIKGLWLCTDFLSPKQQSSLLSSIQSEGWFTEASNNQAMRFGVLPIWATELSDLIRDAVALNDRLPSEFLYRMPIFDQLIVNLYNPGEGISAHVDLMRFEDGIAVVSLDSSCVMHFSRAREELSGAKIPVYLSPGSLVLLTGEARYDWKHEINRKPGFQVWEGRELDQKRRISVTLRKLCRAD